VGENSGPARLASALMDCCIPACCCATFGQIKIVRHGAELILANHQNSGTVGATIKGLATKGELAQNEDKGGLVNLSLFVF
jgi:hypothetical protein